MRFLSVGVSSLLFEKNRHAAGLGQKATRGNPFFFEVWFPAGRVLICLLFAVWLAACSDAGEDAGADITPPARPADGGTDGRNSAWGEKQPYLVLVSIDGFRHDYLDRYPGTALKALAASGIRARALLPAYPTLTFPNHYSIATGLWPASHGIVANTFPGDDPGDWYAYKDPAAVRDGRWYGGEPIWVAAERHGMVSAAFYFVGTEAPVAGVEPSHWHAFDREVPGEARVEQVLAWLAEPPATRPHMVTLYFEEVDETSHRYGPGSAESIAAIANVDRYIGRLVDGIDALDVADEVTIIVVSDHGQSAYRRDTPALVLDEVADLRGLTVVDGGSYAFLFAGEASAERLVEVRDAINDAWPHGRAWLKDETPPGWHVATASRFPELIVQADPGHGVIRSRDRYYIMTAGDHGWAPEFTDMHGIFIAAGPRIPRGLLIEPLGVVDLYPMMRDVLNLPPAIVDGDPGVLLPLLAPASRTPQE